LRKKGRDSQQNQNFIDNINEYITTLEENESVNLDYNKKESEDERDRLMKRLQRAKKSRADEDEYDIQEIIK
jgi:hypothetical protein